MWKVFTIIFWIFFQFLSLLSLFYSFYVVLMHLMVFHVCPRLCSLFFSFSFHLAYLSLLLLLQVCEFFLLPVKIYCCNLLVLKKFSYLYFATLEFPLGFFSYISLLIFSIWRSSVILSPFTSLILISFSYVIIFRMAILKSFSGKSTRCTQDRASIPQTEGRIESLPLNCIVLGLSISSK